MSEHSAAGEKQAVIVISVLACLVMVAAIIGFAIWDRQQASAIAAKNEVALPVQNRPLPGTPNRMNRPKPVSDPGTWVTPDDYPARALVAEHEGITAFRLTISKNGNPLFCDITQSSGHDELDSATCKALMRKARFNPALDASGKAVVSSYVNRVKWQIPLD